MTSPRSNNVALGPDQDRLLVDAIERGGARLTGLDDAEALVWAGGVSGFPDRLPHHISWVQLPSAGVEQWFDSGVIATHPGVHFTSAAGAFSCSVAEHALMMLLAGVRSLPEHLAANSWQQERLTPTVGTLRGRTVAIVGAGGIGRALVPMLAAVGAESVAVNRSGTPVPGAVRTLPVHRLGDVWSTVDHVVVAAPATAATKNLVGARQLRQLQSHSWLINVARGSLVDTDALVEALRDGTIAGAGLDVTEPEPLPDGHPLWSLTNAIVTPHDSNPPSVRERAFAEHVRANVARFVCGQELTARVDAQRGY